MDLGECAPGQTTGRRRDGERGQRGRDLAKRTPEWPTTGARGSASHGTPDLDQVGVLSSVSHELPTSEGKISAWTERERGGGEGETRVNVQQQTESSIGGQGLARLQES